MHMCILDTLKTQKQLNLLLCTIAYSQDEELQGCSSVFRFLFDSNAYKELDDNGYQLIHAEIRPEHRTDSDWSGPKTHYPIGFRVGYINPEIRPSISDTRNMPEIIETHHLILYLSRRTV